MVHERCVDGNGKLCNWSFSSFKLTQWQQCSSLLMLIYYTLISPKGSWVQDTVCRCFFLDYICWKKVYVTMKRNSLMQNIFLQIVICWHIISKLHCNKYYFFIIFTFFGVTSFCFMIQYTWLLLILQYSCMLQISQYNKISF